ncbi:NAD-dependent epimerase/dehydratase family protein [Caballeronia mineralivorans]|uniref:NAD-dependent epimerase/dehydratase family protein n=1 Tax=Caballeronia mineralivorans TaxID=2010198 RepID=UPI00094F56D2|nr:NAD(P)-dependent oxidoreductase [Caballeronia mineralivorans]
MKILVTGSAGHLGEALMRILQNSCHEAIGLDIKPSPFTQLTGSICDRDFVADCLRGVNAVVHTATLHKPHVATHTRHDFIDTNITGTLNLLEESVRNGVESFVFTSTTSVYGRALAPSEDKPTAWITEDVVPICKNIYGVTKLSAENLCELFHYRSGLPCIILRTARFFSEEDDDEYARRKYTPDNLKVNEFLYRRVDLEDAATAHLLAAEKAPEIGLARYVVSATTPFSHDDLVHLRTSTDIVVRHLFPEYENIYARLGWSMLRSLDRVYVNERARMGLGWQPKYDFRSILRSLATSCDFRSALSLNVGTKGYHTQRFSDGPYPVDTEVAPKIRTSRVSEIALSHGVERGS